MEIEFSLSSPPNRLLLTVCQGSRQPAGPGGQASVPVGLFLKALACAGVECGPGLWPWQASLISSGLRGYHQSQGWAKPLTQLRVCPQVGPIGKFWGIGPNWTCKVANHLTTVSCRGEMEIMPVYQSPSA